MWDTYLNSSLNQRTKVPSSRGTAFTDIHPSMEHLPSNHRGCPNQHKNSYKLYNETGHHVFSLMKSQWQLRQSHDPNFQWWESHCRTNTSVGRNKSKRAGL